MAKKIPSTKSSLIDVGPNTYMLEPAVSRAHYGEHRTISGGQPYAFPAKRADAAWFVTLRLSGNRYGVLEGEPGSEWSFQKIRSKEETPRWLKADYHDTPAAIYNLERSLSIGSTPEEAIAKGMGIRLSASHMTMKKTPRQLQRDIDESLSKAGRKL